MLDKVVAEFVDGFATEQAFYMPFRALLHAEGYQKIHFLHGNTEWGRDFSAQKVRGRHPTQFAFQLKKGDVKQSDWLEVKNQCDMIFYTNMVHPGIDDDLRREAVLVLTGRFKGNASQLASQWAASLLKRGQDRFTFWDRDTLVEKFRAHLAVSSSAQWEVLGHLVEQCREGTAGLEQLELFSQRWLSINIWQAMLEYCLAREFLVRNGLTLHAFHLFLGLTRRFATDTDFQSADWNDSEQIMRDELSWYAKPILDWFSQVSPEMRKHAVVDVSPMELVSCGARLFLMLEIVTLDFLVNGSRTSNPNKLVAFLEYALRLGTMQRPISDQYAVAIPIIALACRQLGVNCQEWLRNIVIWVGDSYERGGGLGLGGTHCSPLEELQRVLTPPELATLKPNAQSLVATAVLQALQLVQADDLRKDAALDFETLRISAGRLHPVLWPAESLVDGRGCRFKLENLEAIAQGLPVRAPDDFARPFDLAGKTWLALVLMLLLRDRWWSYSLQQLAQASPVSEGTNASVGSDLPAKGSKKSPRVAGAEPRNPKTRQARSSST